MASDTKDKNNNGASDDQDDVDLEEGADVPPRRKLSGKKIVVIAIALVVLLGGGGAGAYFMGLFGGSHEDKQQAEDHAEEEASKDLVFYDLPEILVNLNTTGRKSSYLKIKVALELNDPNAVPLLDARMPRIIDNFQVYLRELRIDDLQGSEGMFRLKEELLSRVNRAVKPVKIADVLFKEMLVQ